MILHKIKMENFRQFKGEQEIIFESRLPNITIIYGENGRGKTGIFRALMFALFDARRLPQDEDASTRDINLVNKQMLGEREGEPVIASVTVVLSNAGVRYEVKRCIQGVKKKDQIAEQPYGVSLIITDENGNTKPPIKDAVEIGEYIGHVFDPKIKDYFLFDGEKIERLTRADSVQKKTVAEGIKNLLNINDLEVARRSMEILRGRFNEQVSIRSQGNLPKVLHALEKNAQDVAENEKEQKKARENLDNAQKQKKKLDVELEKIDAIKGLLEKRREYIENEEDIQETQAKRVDFLAKRLSPVARLLLKKYYTRVYDAINNQKEAGEIPVQDKLELIKKIFADGKCICGTCILQDTPEYNALVAWRERIIDSGLKDEALNLWRDLSNLLSSLPIVTEEVQRYLSEYETGKKKLNEIREKLKSLSENINDGEEDAARQFNRQREQCLQDIGVYKNRIAGFESEAERLQLEKNDLLRRKEQVVQEEGIKSELVAAANLSADTFETLDEIYSAFTSDMKQQISQQASHIMHKLLDKEGRYSLKCIIVKDDYSLQVNDQRDEPFLANISAGQRQIISLCFITALAQVANGTSQFEIPLFMDTPFGRLSFEHRYNLIRFIPTICQQWITMVTDTELTEKEWNVYREAPCRCSFYKLCSQSDGTTKILSVPFDKVTQAIM